MEATTNHSAEIVPPHIDIEWDEPGAGGIVVDGVRLVHFSLDTDWSEAWSPQVNEAALRFIDSLPRLRQEVEMALDTARRYEAETKALAAEFGREDGR